MAYHIREIDQVGRDEMKCLDRVKKMVVKADNKYEPSQPNRSRERSS